MAAIPGKLQKCQAGKTVESKDVRIDLHVKEDACCFRHTFSQPSGPALGLPNVPKKCFDDRPCMFKIKLSLRHWLLCNDISG